MSINNRMENVMTAKFQYLVGICLICVAFFCGMFVRTTPIITPTIQHPAPNVETIQVPYEVLTTKVIKTIAKEYVPAEDRAGIEQLAKQNESLKIQIEQLNRVVATIHTSGSGPIQQNIDKPTDFKFDDGRLIFTKTEVTGTYDLYQKFIITNTVGKNKRGVPTNLFRLEEDIKGKRVVVDDKALTVQTIAATPQSHWFVSPRIQMGIGIMQSKTPTGGFATANNPHPLFAIQWLKKGKTAANEDIRFAFLSPAVSLNAAEKTVGVLPVSFNIGSLPKQPFTNIWISPYIGTTTKTGVNRIGVFASVTF